MQSKNTKKISLKWWSHDSSSYWVVLHGSWKQPKDPLLSIAVTLRGLEEHFHHF